MKYFIILITLILSYSYVFSQDEEPFWEFVGGLGAPDGGVGFDIAVDTKDNFYIGTSRGIFRSTDSGDSWEHVLKNGTRSRKVLSVQSSNNGYVFAIVGFTNGDKSDANLFVSKDFGDTWETVNEPWWDEFNDGIQKFSIDNDNEVICVYIYTDKYLFYFSPDWGETWEMADTNNYIWEKDTKFKTIAATGGTCAVYVNLSTGSDGTLFYTTDKGKAWVKREFGEMVLNLVPLGSGKVLLSKRGDLLKLDLINNKDTTIMTGKRYHDIYVRDENNFVSKQNDVVYTTDGGESWVEIVSISDTTSLLPVWHGHIAYDSKNNFIQSINGIGIIKSSDEGKTWNRSYKGFSVPYIKNIAFDKDDNVYVPSYSGLYKSTDKGTTWEPAGLDSLYLMSSAMALNHKNELMVFKGEKVYKSSDGGENWKGYPENDTTIYMTYHDVDQDSRGNILAITNWTRSIHSTDYGDTWTKYRHEIFVPQSCAVNNEGHMFIGGNSGDIRRSTDYGKTWEEFERFPLPEIEVLIFHSREPVGYGITALGLLKTTDNGRSWFQLPWEDPPGIAGNAIVDSTGKIWFGLHWCSSDFGKTWEYLDRKGLLSHNALTIGVSPAGYIYASIQYQGLWRSIKPHYSPVKDNSSGTKTNLFSAIPNPAYETADIGYYLSRSSWVKLKLFNSLGIEVVTLVSEYQDVGVHSQILDATGLSPGMYFYQLETEEGIETKKIVVVR